MATLMESSTPQVRAAGAAAGRITLGNPRLAAARGLGGLWVFHISAGGLSIGETRPATAPRDPPRPAAARGLGGLWVFHISAGGLSIGETRPATAPRDPPRGLPRAGAERPLGLPYQCLGPINWRNPTRRGLRDPPRAPRPARPAAGSARPAAGSALPLRPRPRMGRSLRRYRLARWPSSVSSNQSARSGSSRFSTMRRIDSR